MEAPGASAGGCCGTPDNCPIDYRFCPHKGQPPVAAPEAPTPDTVTLPRAVLDSTLDALRKAQMFKVSAALSNAASSGAAPEAPASAQQAGYDKLREYTTLLNVAEAEIDRLDRELTEAKATTASASGECQFPNCDCTSQTLDNFCRRAPAPGPDAKMLDGIIAAVCAKHPGTAWANSHRQAMREVAEAFAQQSATLPANPTE